MTLSSRTEPQPMQTASPRAWSTSMSVQPQFLHTPGLMAPPQSLMGNNGVSSSWGLLTLQPASVAITTTFSFIQRWRKKLHRPEDEMRCWRSKVKQQNSSPDKTSLDLLDRLHSFPTVYWDVLMSSCLQKSIIYTQSCTFTWKITPINLLLQIFGSNRADFFFFFLKWDHELFHYMWLCLRCF